MRQGKIAILGATSHIAKGLIFNMKLKGKCALSLFARDVLAVNNFLKSIDCLSGCCQAQTFEKFGSGEYGVIINCVGSTDQNKIRSAGKEIIEVTEKFDNMVIEYLSSNTDTLYINFSSGIVHNGDYTLSAGNGKDSGLPAGNFYKIAKIESEARHRARPELNIVDLRVFSYFSRFADMDRGDFIGEVMHCLKKRTEFLTGPGDMERDYSHPSDILNLIDLCINRPKINDAYDVYSIKPVKKSQVLEYFIKNHGLRVKIDNSFDKLSATGNKVRYFSDDKKAGTLGFEPKYSSLDCIKTESVYILEDRISV